MRMVLRDEQRHLIGRIEVDPATRPTRVVTQASGSNGFGLPAFGFRRSGFGPGDLADNQRPQGEALVRRADSIQPKANRLLSREVFLNWDTALDDSGQLRRCIACGCTDLFREKAFPQVTAVIVVLAFAGAIVGALGLANTPVLIAMLVILVLDVAILVLSRRRLVCYQCRSTYHDLPIARYHRAWDRAVADRHPAPQAPPPSLAAAQSPPPPPPPDGAIKSGMQQVQPQAAPAGMQKQPASSDTNSPSETTNYFASP